jgi:hypothetical protein
LTSCTLFLSQLWIESSSHGAAEFESLVSLLISLIIDTKTRLAQRSRAWLPCGYHRHLDDYYSWQTNLGRRLIEWL